MSKNASVCPPRFGEIRPWTNCSRGFCHACHTVLSNSTDVEALLMLVVSCPRKPTHHATPVQTPNVYGVCSVGYVPKHTREYLLGKYCTEGIGKDKVRYGIQRLTEHSGVVRYELDTGTGHFGRFGTPQKYPGYRNYIPYRTRPRNISHSVLKYNCPDTAPHGSRTHARLQPCLSPPHPSPPPPPPVCGFALSATTTRRYGT